MMHIKRTLAVTGLASIIATQALALDDCLIGMWEPDYLQFGDQMMDVMEAEQIQISGDVLMTIFDTGDGEYLITSMTIGMKMPDVPQTDVTLTGTGEFAVTADDESFFFTMGDFNYLASATIAMPGMDPITMDIPVTDEMTPIGSAAGLYSCNEETLEFEPIRGDDGKVGNIIQKWLRL